MNPQENSVMKNLDFSEADRFFKTIGEVSAEIGIPPHVLRFWESKFLNIKPHKRKGGHRYYSKVDVEAIYQIKRLLYEEGYTIKGAQKYLKEKGFMQHKNTEDQQNLFNQQFIPQQQNDPVNSISQPSLLDVPAQQEEKPVDHTAVKLLLDELKSIKRTLET